MSEATATAVLLFSSDNVITRCCVVNAPVAYCLLYGCADRPQLMMYVDGEFVWIPASRVPDALNFIAV